MVVPWSVRVSFRTRCTQRNDAAFRYCMAKSTKTSSKAHISPFQILKCPALNQSWAWMVVWLHSESTKASCVLTCILSDMQCNPARLWRPEMCLDTPASERKHWSWNFPTTLTNQPRPCPGQGEHRQRKGVSGDMSIKGEGCKENWGRTWAQRNWFWGKLASCFPSKVWEKNRTSESKKESEKGQSAYLCQETPSNSPLSIGLPPPLMQGSGTRPFHCPLQ